MSLGLYLPGRSLIHRLPASFKLVTLALAGVSVFFIQAPLGLMNVLVLTLLLFRVAQLPLQQVWQQVYPILPLLVGLCAIHTLLQDGRIGLVVVLRFLVLMLLASLVTLTTRMSDLIATLEQSLRPLTPFGIQPAKVSMTLAIAIRFVPVLLDQAKAIQEAQWSRGLDRHFLALLVPLLVKTLRLADDLTDALDARCYDGDQ